MKVVAAVVKVKPSMSVRMAGGTSEAEPDPKRLKASASEAQLATSAASGEAAGLAGLLGVSCCNSIQHCCTNLLQLGQACSCVVPCQEGLCSCRRLWQRLR